MPMTLSKGLTAVILLLFPMMASAQISLPSDVAAWTPAAGDRVLVDTEDSIVHLVHENGQFISLNGLTGQHRNVYAVGRYYYAATPTKNWIVTSVEEKGPSVTFGAGRFLRLFEVNNDGSTERTAYGMHSHRSFDMMLNDKIQKTGFDKAGKGYRSLGCVLLSEKDLTIVVDTLAANGGTLSVQTAPGLTPPPVEVVDANTPPSWLPW